MPQRKVVMNEQVRTGEMAGFSLYPYEDSAPCKYLSLQRETATVSGSGSGSGSGSA